MEKYNIRVISNIYSIDGDTPFGVWSYSMEIIGPFDSRNDALTFIKNKHAEHKALGHRPCIDNESLSVRIGHYRSQIDYIIVRN
jgi:hypothetical protein